ncbi:MAG: hypothetical protein J6M65_05525 [Eubacterium sp.]|nr:hypothetical protein [Eubacterium sp.]
MIKDYNLADPPSIQFAKPSFPQIDPIPQEVLDAIDERNRKNEQAQQAQINAAEDIAQMKNQMNDVINNQKSQIEILQKQIQRQERTIDQLQDLNEVQSSQLQKLKEIFYSLEDGTAVDKEIMKDLEELLSKQPGWKEFIKDKGVDVAIGGFVAILPQLLKMIGVEL